MLDSSESTAQSHCANMPVFNKWPNVQRIETGLFRQQDCDLDVDLKLFSFICCLAVDCRDLHSLHHRTSVPGFGTLYFITCNMLERVKCLTLIHEVK